MKLASLTAILASLLLFTGCGGGLRQTRVSVDETLLGKIAWGQPTNGLRAGIEVNMPEDQFVFTGHLKNASDKSIRIVDPKVSGQTWGVIASGIEERITNQSASDQISTEGMPESSVIELKPGEEIRIPLRHRVDSDLVPYSATVRYVYVNQAQSLLDAKGQPISDMWIGRIVSGEISIQTGFKNSKVTKVNRG